MYQSVVQDMMQDKVNEEASKVNANVAKKSRKGGEVAFL